MRSDELSDSVLAMLESGSSTADAADWLAGQDAMAEVMSGSLGVWFRLEGGRGTWVVTEAATFSEPSPSAPPTGPVTPSRAPADVQKPRVDGAEPRVVAQAAPDDRALPRPEATRRSFVNLAAGAGLAEHIEHTVSRIAPGPITRSRTAPDVQRPLFDIVGSGSAQKNALVLSPFLWEFLAWDDGTAVTNILASTRGYEGAVNYLFNADRTSADVSLASFTGWNAYDVVHVVSHGARICKDGPRRGVLFVTVLDAFAPAGLSDAELMEKLKELNQPGVELVKGAKAKYVGVNADFFRNENLEDTVIFFNSCQLFGGTNTDLIDTLTGTSNVVLSWTEAVYTDDAYDAAVHLYEDLSEGGYPATIAYDKLGDLRTGRPTKHAPSPTLRMTQRPTGGDLQIREVVTLLDPASGQKLTADDRVQIEGIPGDGEPDAAPFLVQVDGVLADHASDMLLQVSVDGVASDPVQVSSGTANEQDQWIVEGQVPLGYDLEDDRPVTFLARVELASEGESEHEVEAILTGASWTLVSEGQMAAEASLHGVDAQSAITWTAEAQFAVDGEGRVVGQGMGFLSGTFITGTYDDEQIFCFMSGPVELGVVFDLTGQQDGGGLSLETENLESAEFSETSCDGVEHTEVEAALLFTVATILETTVPFEHEAVQERELPASGSFAYDGIVVGSFETLHTWTNTIRKEGCPVGADDAGC